MSDVRIRWFASLAETTGVADETLDMPPGSTVGDAWEALCGRHPALREIGYRPLVACDRVYARRDRVLDGVGEVAFLPPVSGG